MFKISVTPTYTAPVTVEIPGEVKPRTFTAEFHRLDQDQVAELVKRSQSGELDDRGIAHEVMAGWDGVADESGDALEFTRANLDRLLAIYPVPAGIVKGFFGSLDGARAKN